MTDGKRTFWHWERSFAAPPGTERERRDRVASGVYVAGFANLRQQAGSGTGQLFSVDPNGAMVELDFDAAENAVKRGALPGVCHPQVTCAHPRCRACGGTLQRHTTALLEFTCTT